jgi:hypothetical protein
MALFNLRLGWWLGNPGKAGKKSWKRNGPTFSAWVMLREMLGFTSDSYEFVYLSDGGHFENLGLYEMVLRRCRFIVVVDAGCDRENTFEDLGNAIRKIRIDLSTQITIDINPILKENRRAVTGIIEYPATEDNPAMTGQIVYIKPVISNNEPPDIFNYYKTNDAFPHEPTSDQWFNESQFESYRMLGFHTIKDLVNFEWECSSLEQFQRKIETTLSIAAQTRTSGET